MIEKEKLKEYANKLMFDMAEKEYETLQEEFNIILKQIELIEKIDGIKDVEPMTFPYLHDVVMPQKDVVEENDVLTVDEVLSNTKFILKDQVKVPKVVE